MAALRDPAWWGVIGFVFTCLAVAAARARGARGVPAERLIWTVFLAGMPLIYVALSMLRGGDRLYVELLGLAFYGGLALAGRRWNWLLAVGIVAHGLGWDAWHLDSPYVPTWYAVGCALVDLAAGVYVATRLRAWARTDR